MTVRAWFTISAVVLVLLGSAVAYQFLRPLKPPNILVTVGGEQLDGGLESVCWPNRDGKLRCEDHRRTVRPEQRLPGRGVFRNVVAFPAQPDDGAITVTRMDGKVVLEKNHWARTFSYTLDPDIYVLRVEGIYPEDAHVAYYFPFTVTRSAS